MKNKITIIALIIFIFIIIIGTGTKEKIKQTSGNADNQNSVTQISKFDYSIEDRKLILNRYKGREDFVLIGDNYEIDGINYGVTQIAHAIFNGCSASVIYLPKTLTCVYDDTLAYLNAEHIDLYFEGSQEEWNRIFTKYEKASASEKWNEGDAEGAGAALADKLNAKMGHTYDESKFTYHFETKVTDIPLN